MEPEAVVEKPAKERIFPTPAELAEIDRAKDRLMRLLGHTEPQAHRALQVAAMLKRIRRVEVARAVLRAGLRPEQALLLRADMMIKLARKT